MAKTTECCCPLNKFMRTYYKCEKLDDNWKHIGYKYNTFVMNLSSLFLHFWLPFICHTPASFFSHIGPVLSVVNRFFTYIIVNTIGKDQYDFASTNKNSKYMIRGKDHTQWPSRDKLIFINHVICLGEDSVLVVRVLIKEKINRESFWFFNLIPFDIFEIFVSSFFLLIIYNHGENIKKENNIFIKNIS